LKTGLDLWELRRVNTAILAETGYHLKLKLYSFIE